MTGEQHEQAVEALRAGLVMTPYEADEGLRAYFASLARQGVVLVDLGEVVEYVRREDRSVTRTSLTDAIERRFGGNERKQ